MKVETLYFGEIDVKEENILTFEAGIPGFKDEKHFTIIRVPENPTFNILQSIKTKELSFVLTEPYLFYYDYEFDLDDGTISQLDLEKPDDVSIYTIVTLHDSLDSSTLNLQAPVVLNINNNKAKQMVLNDKRYKTKHPLKRESEGKAHASINAQNR